MYTEKQVRKGYFVTGLIHYLIGLANGIFIGWLIWG